MSAEQNKTIFRRYVEEIWNNGKLKAAGEIMAEQFAFHGPGRDLAGLELLDNTWRRAETLFQTFISL
jgi:hypothetical protein